MGEGAPSGARVPSDFRAASRRIEAHPAPPVQWKEYDKARDVEKTAWTRISASSWITRRHVEIAVEEAEKLATGSSARPKHRARRRRRQLTVSCWSVSASSTPKPARQKEGVKYGDVIWTCHTHEQQECNPPWPRATSSGCWQCFLVRGLKSSRRPVIRRPHLAHDGMIFGVTPGRAVRPR